MTFTTKQDNTVVEMTVHSPAALAVAVFGSVLKRAVWDKQLTDNYAKTLFEEASEAILKGIDTGNVGINLQGKPGVDPLYADDAFTNAEFTEPTTDGLDVLSDGYDDEVDEEEAEQEEAEQDADVPFADHAALAKLLPDQYIIDQVEKVLNTFQATPSEVFGGFLTALQNSGLEAKVRGKIMNDAGAASVLLSERR